MKHLALFLMATTLFVACQSDKTTNLDDFSSSRSKFADQVNSFTGGVISITSPIKLRLAHNMGEALSGTKVEENIFSFSPSIEGTTTWEDNQTLVFTPSKNLKSGQKYEATANLESLFEDLEKDQQEFKFTFQTLVQNFDVSVGGLQYYKKTDLTKVKAEGYLQTADFAPLESIKEITSATQNGKALTINWQNSTSPNAYVFTIENVVRGEQAGEVLLHVDGSPINVSKKDDLKIEIPSLSDFKVVSAQIVKEKENYISVVFSDPLNERQNLKGMVTFKDLNMTPRVVVNLNELKIYPTRTITNKAELVVNSGVKNVANFKLKEDYKAILQFTQSKPEVRFVNTDNKAILPSSNGMVLPFEAVGLKAVDVWVVKIYEDNILQYLQVNNIGGQSQLNRVGKPIVRKTIPLNTSGVTDLNSWNRFTLNLEDIIKTEPGAIYQVNMGFKKRHSLYVCESESSDNNLMEGSESWVDEAESSYWDSYENYYYYGYNWSERDNPCSDSYYGRRRSINKILFASDIGIIAKRNDNNYLKVFVTNLLTTQPLSGVEVEVYDFQQQLIDKKTTDSEGMTEFTLDETPFLIVANQNNKKGYLKINDGSSLSLSNFNVSGTKIKKGLKGFIYGERGVWRPADTVHLGFILTDVTKELPEHHPVIMELFNPNNQLAYRKVSSNAVDDMYRFDFVTDSDAPTGNWLAKAKVGGAQFTKTVKIETIKPNRLKVNLTFDKDKFTASDRSVSGDLDVRWLSGATASNLKAEYDLLLTPVKTSFDEYPNFTFDDASKDFYSDRTTVYQGRIDDNGQARVTIDLGNTRNAPGALNAKLYGKVYEEGGDFSISNVTVPYYPYTSFVGVKAPEGDKRGMLLTDKDLTVRIATVNTDGLPVSRQGVRVELYKVQWRWWWDNSYDNISNYVGGSYHEPIQEGKINTSAGEGEWKLRVNYPDWGRYYIKVTDPISGHSAGQVVYLDWPGWAGKAKRGQLEGASMLDFSVDKEEYSVGEQVTLTLPTTAGNRILVSLESGSKIIQTLWAEANEGNTNISFKATSDMAPNVYAHLTMIQPHRQDKNDLPIRLYGVQSIKVVDPATILEPTIKMPSELRPEEKFSIEVSEKNGKAMAYTVAVVDEGLLDITNFKTPDPWTSFFAREALGIKTWDIYDDVIGAYSGKLEHLLAVGGDGELQPKEQKEANRFKPVVKFIGPFHLGAGKTAKHSLQMPQYIGSVKTMVVAAADGAYGKAEQVTPVKQPLMILATLPRVAGPGETMKLPVNVFTMDDQVKNVSISVETDGQLEVSGSKTQAVTFSKSGDKVVYFDMKIKEAVGIGKVKVTAKSGKLTATYDIEMNIIPRNPPVTTVDSKIINPGEEWITEYERMGLLGLNSGSVEVSTFPSLNLEKRLGYLVRYPHGCIEQTTSAMFGQLFLTNLTKVPDYKKDKIQKNINAGINRLKLFQNYTGGFTYWPGSTTVSAWGTNYGGHFLLEAQKAGYSIPQSMLSAWIMFQQQEANTWSSQRIKGDALVQAYRLYTLALAGKPALGAMNRLKEDTKIDRITRWRLALAYAVAGYDKQANEIISVLSTAVENPTGSYYYRYTFGSQYRDKAMILETLIALDKKEKAFELLLDIANEMGEKNRWMSTQTTAYCFIAISKYADMYKLDEETKVVVQVGSEKVNVSGKDYVNQVDVQEPDKDNSIQVVNNGKAPVYARLIRSGTPIEGTEQAASRNIQFDVNYVDQQGNAVDVSKLPQGTNFKAVVTVSNPGLNGYYNELALTQIFPSGWEIINTRLDGSDNASSIAKYVDIRDDRVMHYFDLRRNQKASFTVLLNAAYKGKYYLPAASVGAMYDNKIFANTTGRWVEVVGEGR